MKQQAQQIVRRSGFLCCNAVGIQFHHLSPIACTELTSIVYRPLFTRMEPSGRKAFHRGIVLPSTIMVNNYDRRENTAAAEEDGESVDTSLYTSDDGAAVPFRRTPSISGASVVTNGTEAFFHQVRRSKQGKKPKKRGDGWDSESSSSMEDEECSSTSPDEYGFDGNSLYDLEMQSHTMMSIDTPLPRTANAAPVGTVVSTIRRSVHERSYHSKPYSRRVAYYERYRHYKICLISVIALALAVSVGMVVLLFMENTNSYDSSWSLVPTTAPTKAPTVAPTKAPTTAPTKAPTTAPTKTPTAAPTTASVVPPTTMAPVVATDTAITEESSNSTTEGETSVAEVDEQEEEEVEEEAGEEAEEEEEVEIEEEQEEEIEEEEEQEEEEGSSATTTTEDPVTASTEVELEEATENSTDMSEEEESVMTTETQAPTFASEFEAPTEVPVMMEAPTEPEEPCVDTNQPVLSVATELQGCDWLASRPAAQVLFCSEEAIGRQCRVTCGTCTRRL